MINKSAKFMIDSINDCYSDLSDDQRTTANRVLKLCHEAVSNGVYKKRQNKVIKKLLVDSIFDPQINFGD